MIIFMFQEIIFGGQVEKGLEKELIRDEDNILKVIVIGWLRENERLSYSNENGN